MFGTLQNSGTDVDKNLHSANAAYEEETVPLVTRDVSHRHCCQPDMNARWLKPQWWLSILVVPRECDLA